MPLARAVVLACCALAHGACPLGACDDAVLLQLGQPSPQQNEKFNEERFLQAHIDVVKRAASEEKSSTRGKIEEALPFGMPTRRELVATRESLRRILAAQNELAADYAKMAEDMEGPVNDLHAAAGERLDVENITEPVLEEVLPFLQNLLAVAREGYTRSIDHGREHAEEIREYFSDGEGQALPELRDFALPISGPAAMERQERMLVGPIAYSLARVYNRSMVGDGELTLEQKKQALREVRLSLHKMRDDVDHGTEAGLRGQQRTRTELRVARLGFSLFIGAEVFDQLEEAFELLWSNAQKARDVAEAIDGAMT